MNFYNGVENTIKRVCKLYYDCFPKGNIWHKDLLELSCEPPQGKEAIFSEDIVKKFKRVKHPNTLLAAASVQEEVGLRGAQTVGYMGNPDVCIVCDTGIAQDIPPEGFSKEEKVGAGPAILIYDAGMIPNLKLRDLVVKTAEQKKIPHHLTYMERGATDGGRIHVGRIGVPSVVIGPPVRYIHSHNSILHRTDYDNTVKLITEVVKKLDARTVRSLTED